MMIVRMDPRLTNCAEQSCGLCSTWRNSEKAFLRKRHLNENFDDEESASQKEWELQKEPREQMNGGVKGDRDLDADGGWVPGAEAEGQFGQQKLEAGYKERQCIQWAWIWALESDNVGSNLDFVPCWLCGIGKVA